MREIMDCTATRNFAFVTFVTQQSVRATCLTAQLIKDTHEEPQRQGSKTHQEEMRARDVRRRSQQPINNLVCPSLLTHRLQGTMASLLGTTCCVI